MTPSKPRFVQTFTGRVIDLSNAKANDFSIQDIGWALAHQCRFNGHVRGFYSVAAHSVEVSSRLLNLGHSDQALAGLLHDAAEAFLGDVPAPVKWFLRENTDDPDGRSTYDIIEEDFASAIFEKFCPNTVIDFDAIKAADQAALFNEAKQLLTWPPAGLWSPPDTPTIPLNFVSAPPTHHFELFMDTFVSLAGDEYDIEHEAWSWNL